MDPNTALQNARRAARKLDEEDGARTNRGVAAAEELAEAFVALDNWLSAGGFLPADWRTVIAWQEPR